VNQGGDAVIRPHLTPRERDIVEALLQGFSNRMIAEKLGLHVQTVKNQLTIIYAKFGVGSRLELNVHLHEMNKPPM